MKQLGMITIGQAPRTDVAPIMKANLGAEIELVQMGVLDRMEKEQIEAELGPVKGDYVLTSKLVNGHSVVMSREKIKPLLQKKINEMEAQGITNILLLCTGVFPGLKTKKAFLIEPDHIIPPAVKALAGDRKLGVIAPLKEQKDNLKLKFIPLGLAPVFAVASPYQNGESQFLEAADELKGQADLIVMDCMGYTEEMRKKVSEAAGLPVILSNALMAKLVSEII